MLCGAGILEWLLLQLWYQAHVSTTFQSSRKHWGITIRSLTSSSSCRGKKKIKWSIWLIHRHFSLFTLRPPWLISKLCTHYHYSLSHVWKPTLTVAWLIAWLKGEVLSPLLTIFATSWFQACPKCSWKRTRGLFESRLHTSQKAHVGITPCW